MKKKTIVVAVIIVLVVAGGVLYWNFTRSPWYSFLQIGRAIHNHDYALFEKYVDSEGILNRSIDQVFEIILSNVDPENVWGQFGQYFGNGLLNTFKPQLTLLYKKQIQEWIETGKMQNDSTHKELNSYSLPNVFSRQGAVSFTGIEYEVRDHGSATIGLGVRLERFDTVLVFSVKMKNKGGYWQVGELMNLVAFQKEVDRLEQKRIDKINKPIEQEMLNSLKISNFEKSGVTDHRAKSKGIKLNFTFTNTGNRTISEFLATITISNSGGSFTKEMKINTETINVISEEIKPGNTATLVWPSEGSYHTDQQLYSISKSEMSLSLSVQYIQFEDGTSLRLAEKWESL